MNRIKIIEVGPVVSEKTAKGGYFHFTLKYDQGTGKPWTRKLVSFVKPDTAYQVLKNAKEGEQYDIEQVKDDSGNWQWPNAVKVDQDAKPTTGGTMKSTYETPEERARRQILIVRQSCLAQAVQLGQVNAIDPFGVDVVIGIAEKFEAWVNRE